MMDIKEEQGNRFSDEEGDVSSRGAVGWWCDRIVWGVTGGFFVLTVGAIALLWPEYTTHLHREAMQDAIEAERSEEALEHVRVLVERHPKYLYLKGILADCLLQTGHPEEAVRLLKELAGKQKKYELNLAIAYREAGRASLAQKYLSKVQRRKPDDAGLNYYLGMEAYEAGRYREAARHFQAAAADPYWDERAEAYREKIEEHVFGNRKRELLNPSEDG